MNEKFPLAAVLLLLLILAACTPARETAGPPTAVSTSPSVTNGTETIVPTATQSTEKESTPDASQPLPTPPVPSGTVMEADTSWLRLSHPLFNWQLVLPQNWVIAYDSGYELLANSPDETVFMRLQAQLWPQAEARLPNARAYVNHWKQFIYGDVFPLYADGIQISESELSQNKLGGPYLAYEFHDSNKGIHYLQLYASADGPSSALVSTWTTDDEYDTAQNVMQEILNSFELLEVSE